MSKNSRPTIEESLLPLLPSMNKREYVDDEMTKLFEVPKWRRAGNS